MRLHHEGSMIGVQCQLMICRGHIRASKGTFQFFWWLTVLWQIDILVTFCTFSSFQVEFERVVNGLGGQKSSQGSIKVWSIRIQCKNRKFFYWRVTGALFWVKNIKVPFGIGHPPTYTSNLVYMCAGGFRDHKSSNRIELSQFVQELL